MSAQPGSLFLLITQTKATEAKAHKAKATGGHQGSMAKANKVRAMKPTKAKVN